MTDNMEKWSQEWRDKRDQERNEKIKHKFFLFGYDESDFNKTYDEYGRLEEFPELTKCREHYIIFEKSNWTHPITLEPMESYPNAVKIGKGKGELYTYAVNYSFGAGGLGSCIYIWNGPFTLKEAKIKGVEEYIAYYYERLEHSKIDSVPENFNPKKAKSLLKLAEKALEELTIGTQLSLF